MKGWSFGWKFCSLTLLMLVMASCGSQRKTAGGTPHYRIPARSAGTPPKTTTPPKSNPSPSPIRDVRTKYAPKLGVQASELKSVKLYSFVDSWQGIPYRYGGTNRSGVDCSGFVGALYREVYQKNVPRTSREIGRQSKKIGKSQLREGDLVFFDISGKDSHVGVYLANNHFVHASTSKGVVISSLTNPYYQKAFSAGGRI